MADPKGLIRTRENSAQRVAALWQGQWDESRGPRHLPMPQCDALWHVCTQASEDLAQGVAALKEDSRVKWEALEANRADMEARSKQLEEQVGQQHTELLRGQYDQCIHVANRPRWPMCVAKVHLVMCAHSKPDDGIYMNKFRLSMQSQRWGNGGGGGGGGAAAARNTTFIETLKRNRNQGVVGRK
eukprot:1139657-Pelagomonas_calceolata.AAC.6